MTLNHEVFATDPLTAIIPNDGVAKVTEPRSPEEWAVLRYELSTFVCEGEYRDGLERILSTFLRNVGEAVQPAGWVSGFYGSGKSNLVRILEFCWRDATFPDGATARGLTRLTPEIMEHLQELTIVGRREGGLWSVAGTLGAGSGDSIRLALLGIFFRAAGLPEQYPAARFVIWLRQNGWYDAVRAGVIAASRDFDTEVRNMYVSPILAECLLAAYPSFAESGAAARSQIKSQFPLVPDVSNDEMVATIGDVLALQSTIPGKVPLTLVVLDELQQWVGDDPSRTSCVQEVVEACSSQFGSRLLFLATGQSALTVAGTMAKLKDRFTVLVSLSDKDVETVVRQVVLRKAPTEEGRVRAVLDACRGEIDRQLVSTKIAPNASDTPDIMLADYPLLPVRRRFWERVLRAVDRAGTAGQLRSQLRVVHKAVRDVADKPLGHVVPADGVYWEKSADMLASGTLLREINEIIRRQDDDTADGKLRSRLAATIFLISQLDTSAGVDTGVRATADTLADLLVEDLQGGGAALRRDIPPLLAGMVTKGDLMLVGEEYRLQTREGAAWERDYRTRYTKIFGDDGRIADERSRELKLTSTQVLKDVTLLQGVTKTVRKVELHYSADEPKASTGNVPVWIRDEWSIGEKTVREDAQAAGPDSPTIFVFLPRKGAEELKRAVAGYAAATETLATPPTANTHEAEEARSGMVTRQSGLRRDLTERVSEVLRAAKVYQGTIEVPGEGLRAAVVTALNASAASLYPQFGMGDDAKWDTVKARVRAGSGDPLSVLGYVGDVDKHPVCQAVLSYVGAVGKKGSDVRDKFTGQGYGWPRDTVEGALLALLASGNLRALQNGTPVAAPQVDQAKLGQTEFRVEGATITTVQRIAVEKLVKEGGVTYKTGEVAVAAPSLVPLLIALAQAAGGVLPLPPPPDTAHLEALKSLSGNELLLALFQDRERLAAEQKDWRERKRLAEARLPRWQRFQRLLGFAKELPVASEVAPQAQAIFDNRSLLSDPDPVAPLCAKLTDALRAAVQAAREEHLAVYGNKIEDLYAAPVWSQLDEAGQKQIRAANGLSELPPLKVGTEDEVLASLEATPLPEWDSKTAALAERVTRALLEAQKRLEPTAERVFLPTASLKTVAEVDAYLDKARVLILAHIEAGVAVVL